MEQHEILQRLPVPVHIQSLSVQEQKHCIKEKQRK